MTKIFLIAGEVSGDQLGAALIIALKKQFPDAEIRGIGGDGMMAQGMQPSLFQMDELSVMGLAEVLPRIPKFLRLISATVQAITTFDPDYVISIDAPDFSLRVQKAIKKKSIRAKKIHYVAPTVWAWRSGRAHKIAQFLDGIICLFPFEPIYFEKEGLRACFAGHPVMQSDLFTHKAQDYREQHHIADDQIIVGLFLGSRRSELDMSIPIVKETLEKLASRHLNMTLLIPTLPKWHQMIAESFKDCAFPLFISSDQSQKWSAFTAANFALVVSGTVALEIALAKIPHVLFYRMNKWTWEIVKRLVHTKFAHLGNILLGKAIYPEFLQDEATPSHLATALEELISSPSLATVQRIEGERIAQLLAPNPNENAADRAAAFIKSL